MTPFLSRVAVVAAGLPIVLGSAYLGGWFLLALTAVAGLIALHEFYRLARALRPLVLAGYGGAVAGLLGAQVDGAAWMVGGYLLTFVLAFVFAAVSETRQSTTVAIATTALGAGWSFICFFLLRRLQNSRTQGTPIRARSAWWHSDCLALARRSDSGAPSSCRRT
jgi:hypothetical protein